MPEDIIKGRIRNLLINLWALLANTGINNNIKRFTKKNVKNTENAER